ncbi:MAG: hypothetical protein WAZ27_00470, partial [Minisyncoccia bacterium]
ALRHQKQEHCSGFADGVAEVRLESERGHPFRKTGRASRAERSFDSTESKRALGRCSPPGQKLLIGQVVKLYIFIATKMSA